MAEKTLNTRMQQKHDVEANWKKATGFVPKAGEIIVYDKDTTYSYPRIKIGDGTRTVTALPFVTTSVNGSTGDVRITASDIGAADVNEVEDLKEEATLASAYALKTLINGGDYNNLLNRPCYKEITSASYTIKNDPIVGMTSAFEGAPTPLRQIPDIPSSILSQPLSMTVLMNDNGEVVEIPITTEVVNAGEEVPGAEIYYHVSSILEDLPFMFIKTSGPMPELSIPHAGTFYIDILFSYIISTSPTADISLTINFPNEITIPGKQLDDALIPDNIARLDDIPVQSVNGKTGAVVINAADVGALPDTTEIPSIEGLATETYVDEAVAANKVLLVNCTLTEDGQGFVSDKEIADIVNAATNGQVVQACISDLGIMIPLTFLSTEVVIFTAAIDSGEGAPGVIALSMFPDGNKFSSVQLATYNPEEKDYGKNLLVVTYEKIGNSESLTANANEIYTEYIAGRNVVLLISNGILYHAEYIGSDECRFVHYEFNADGSGTRIVATMTGSRMPVFVTENIAANRSNPNALTINGTSYDGSAKVDITLNASDVGALPDTTVIPSVEGLASEEYVNEQVAALVDSSPDTLNTLNELAAALGDDPNFATTVATQIGNKVDKTTTVNGKALSNNITLSASDVGALPDTTVIPSIEGLATETYVDEAIEAIPEIYLNDYYTKTQTTTQINNAISAINFPVKSVNGKTGAINLIASDVNAEKAGAVAAAIDALRIKNGNNSSIRSAYSAEDDSEYSIGYKAIALGISSKASGSMSYAEGFSTTASGSSSHAEGDETIASGSSSHAEGYNTTANGNMSHAEGTNTTASGSSSHAEGGGTTASETYSHAEGCNTTASGEKSHAEGFNTDASGEQSHAEGDSTAASGEQSHAEGSWTVASGNSSHAEGYYTIASSDDQHVQGRHNIQDTDNKYAHIVGNGTSGAACSNAHTLDWDGLGWFAGGLKIGGTGQDDENAVSVLTENDLTTITESEIDAICGNTNVETWQFTMTDGTITEKQVVVSE